MEPNVQKDEYMTILLEFLDKLLYTAFSQKKDK